jgi:kumamolisin
MTKKVAFLAIAALAITTLATGAFAQGTPAGRVVAPPSTLVRTPGRIHTPLFLFIPNDNAGPAVGNGETPASIACIYGVTPPTTGCPKNGTVLPTGGAKAIAVVEYGQYSNVQNDLNTFSAQFGLPSTTLIQQCYPGPSCPANNGSGWDLETALDVQYAHAMSPNATIIVASFTNDPLADGAEDGAANYIVSNFGSGEVSNSWTYNGGESWCGSGDCELQYDSYFQIPGIVFFASAGDDGLGPAYPSISPFVVSAGGTSIVRDSNGNFDGQETCWSGSGGGISQYEPLPNYQFLITGRVHTHRGTPDWAADANPSTGVEVYSSSYCGGFCVVGGTSVASPLMASIVNQAGNFRPNGMSELGDTYRWYSTPGIYRQYFFDITQGSNGSPAEVGWDECTGLGSIRKPSGF